MAALGLALLSGCSEGPALSPLSAGATVLAFGNSLTRGTGARSDESYPSVLAARTGLKVVNAGVPGEVTAEGLARLPGILERVRPALVILCHGGNDMIRKKDLGVAESNLRAMIDASRAAGAQVVLVGVPAPGILLDTAEFYARVADETGVPIESDILEDLLGDNRYKADAIHPNAKGYARMAEAIEALLRESGAI